MINGSAFQDLGAVIDELEARDMTVLDVVAQRNSLVTDGDLTVEITVCLNTLSSVAREQNVTIRSCENADQGEEVTTTFTIEIPVESDGSVSRSVSKGTTTNSEAADETTTTESERPETPDIQSLAQRSGESNEADVPYYKNHDLLAEVYDEHDTFAAMTEALGVDVTPATVREHMVNHGIHPTSDDSEDESDEEPQDDVAVTIEADGYGLPESVSMNTLVQTVQRSRTLYEAQSKLGLDRSKTREILTDLNLIDLVTARITDDGFTDIDEVVDRIHAASTA